MRALALCILAVSWIALYTIADEPEGETRKCFKTEIGEKCGEDIEYSWMMCGEPPQKCVTSESIFDRLREAVETTTGLKGFESVWCQRHDITRECRDGACELTGTNDVNVMQGTQATGTICSTHEEPDP